ncbi:MAG: divalent-cation tolerance protein CutA [Candidatus Micrarchaeota archaeon]
MIEITTTVATSAQARKIAMKLIESKLAACVSFWKITSIYKWKGKTHRSGEVMLLVKTSEQKSKRAEALLRKLHPYELPMITIAKVAVDKKVVQWVRSATS